MAEGFVAMSDPVDFGRAAWDRHPDASAHPPRRAVEIMLEDIDSGRVKPDHVIVCYGYATDDGTGYSGYYQAGSFGYHARIGLADRIKTILAGDVT